MSNATSETASPITGTGSLKIGSGVATVTLPQGATTAAIESNFRAAQGFAGREFIFTIANLAGQNIFIGCGNAGDRSFRIDCNHESISYNPGMPTGLHHLALVSGANAGSLGHTFQDGVEVNTSFDVNNGNFHPPATGALTVFVDDTSDGLQLVDSVRVSSGARYTGTFIPPIGPLACDAMTLGLWRLDGSWAGS